MRPVWLPVLVFLSSFGVSLGQLAAAEPAAGGISADVPLVGPQVRQAMQDRDYPQARKAVDEAAKAKAAPQDYLAYLKAWSLYLEKQYDAAIAACDQVEKQFPQSPWLRRVRFAKAMAFVRKGDFKSAESIYRAEAEYLLSPLRRQQLAEIYLEFADAYFKPPTEEQKPDYAKALEFYVKALEMGPKPDKRIEVELRAAECYQNAGNQAEAAKAYARFIAEHPASPLCVEARYRLGECRLVGKDPREARRVWQDLLAAHPDSKSERIAEAAFRLAETWNIPSPKTSEELSLGVAALEAFLERFPTHKLASQAHLQIAESYIHRGRYEDAAASLNRFLKDERYRDRKEVPEAWNLLGRSYQLQKKFAEALATWREFLVKYPAQEAWSAVQQEIVDTEYLMGLEKYKAKDYAAAVALLTEFLARHPLDDRNPGIMFLFGQISYEQKKPDAAIADWRRLVSKYPRTDEASCAQYMIARTLERDLGKLEEALQEYRKVTAGRNAEDARQAAARLTSKCMTVAVGRCFRSDETPQLRLTTRNIDTVTVRAYKVDLETYFRKMHLAGGIEKLDISLIDPDKTFAFKVPGYAKHRLIDSSIEVPLPDAAKAGVMAVTISSETLEATAMVIQSDLDVIVKSSRDEVFVLAENMLTGKPWPGVRLLVSDGKRVLAEAATGEGGVFQRSFKELQDAGDVRVLAVAGGHIASSEVRLQGVAVARGLSDKGYIDTDRPAYQAAQTVHVRGCMRRVTGDVYTIEKDKKYTLEVFDGGNRMVWQDDVKLSPLGTFQAEFPLPANATLGKYRILARDDAGHTYQGTFQVHRYQQELIRLAIDSPRRVYYRGDVIEGTLRATYYYGAPLVGKTVRYQLAHEEIHTAKTDAKGEVHFKLPTREFDETQVLRLEASLPEQGVQAGASFLLATQGFAIDVSAVRPVFVAGETFEATVKTRDAEGKPVGEKISLKVFELVPVQGKVGERLVEEHPLATAASDGMARQTLKLAKGGRYLVRVEGTDRFKNPISGELDVQISGDEDRQRLLILADQHTLKAGDVAQVQVHWREDPALALVTFQGARILDHRLVELKKGANRLSIPVGAKLAPNFELAVSVMTDESGKRKAESGKLVPGNPVIRFHAASSQFTVERELQVKLSCKRKGDAPGPIRPGEGVEITVTTTDPQGKPVAAEVSLAMVQRSLFERFAWPAAPIQEYFHGSAREPAVRTASSITFSDHPSTYPINPRLLAERQRQEIAAEEEASRREPLEAQGGGEGRRLAGRSSTPTRPAPRGEASGKMADFDTLIDLIENTIQPDSWEDTKTRRTPRRGGFGGMGGAAPAYKMTGGAAGAEPPGAVPSGQAEGAKPDAAQAPYLTALPVRQTGYWNPSIVTGADGKATLTVTLPEESTAWTLLAKGITADTLVGQAVETLVVKKDLFGELKLPTAFTDGDEAEVGVTVHNDLVDKGPIEVTLKTTIAGRNVEEKKTIDVKAKGIYELAFKTTLNLRDEGRGSRGEERAASATDPSSLIPHPSSVVFELTVAAGQNRDLIRSAVPLLPFGIPVFGAASGSATSDTTAWVELPKDMAIQTPGLQIVIGPTVEQSLLDIVTAPDPWCPFEAGRVASEVESAASDVMAALALQKLLGASRAAGGPQAQLLDGRIRASLGVLVLAQKNDGGWGWTGACQSNRYTSARAVWAISLVRQAGYSVSDNAVGAAIAYLRSQLAEAANSDNEGKAILLHALAVAGHGDFALANHLHRERNSLSPGGLAYLALALAQIDRKAMAAEILDLLGKQNLDAPGGRAAPEKDLLAWSHSPVEVRALEALARQQVAPKSPQAKKLVDWLLAHRTGPRWTPDKATGPAALALCAWFAENRFQGEHYKLAVSVNGAHVEMLDVDQSAATRVVNVPAALLVRRGSSDPADAAGRRSGDRARTRINFQITGRGRYTYQCVLGGFVPADKLKSTTTDWEVERTYEPAPLEFGGRPVPRGFAVVAGKAAEFRNPLTQLPVARRGQVEINLHPKGTAANAPGAPHDFLVISEPIPSGAAVIERSIRGGFDRVEILPGQLVFYVGSRRPIEPIRYELDGYLPGAYRAGPTVVRNAYRPEQLAVAAPASLRVLPLGAASSDPYRLTPQELFELGRLSKEKGDLKAASQHLTELVDKWSLKADVYRQAVEMLLDIHLDLGPASKIVQYFEIVKEKWPDQEVPFAKAVKVGAAYHEIGEFERSYLVFRATIEGSLTRESGVAAVLEEEGAFLRSVDVMSRLLRDYPPESYVAEAEFALAQRVRARAPTAAADPELRAAKQNRVSLVRRAWRMLDSFLTAYPSDPAADQAAFASAAALLEIQDYREAAAAAARYAQRYPQSDLLDTFWYIIGYCDFATGQHQAALEMCRKVAEARRLDKKTGRMGESPNKWRAIYILGQIYHSQGQPADAIREYRRVEERFPDAKLSIAYFLRKGIELPEVTTVKPGTPAEVELTFRNVAACDVKVYRIDLMKFSLLRGDLAGITQINLAGIRPLYDAAAALGEGSYRDRTHKLPLPLAKEGAYLVVCRGEEMHASGLVLVTPLAVEVQYDPVSGQVRSMVKDVVAQRYLTGVQVRVIGAQNNDFVSGATDLRGVFVADGIQGAPTVIAQAGAGRYAFFRSPALASEAPSPAAGLAERPKPVQEQPDSDNPFGRRAATGEQPAEPGEAASAAPRAKRPAAAAPAAVAERTRPAPLSAGAIDMGGRGAAESEKKINAALDSPTQVEFFQTPLTEVVDDLKQRHGIEIQLDQKALEEVSVDPSATQITKSLKGITLRSALVLMLRDLGLTYEVRDEVLLITTTDRAEQLLITKMYPVGDLIRLPGQSSPEDSDWDSLIDLIENNVQPDSWSDTGAGPGSISPFENKDLLVMSNTEEVHREVADLLAQLRSFGGKSAVDAQAAKPGESTPAEQKPPAGPYVTSDIPGPPVYPPLLGRGGRSRGGARGGMVGGFSGMGGMGGMGMGGMPPGGMGGMGMGGMGGFGGTAPGYSVGGSAKTGRPAGATGGMRARGSAVSGGNELLEGLEVTSQQSQQQQVEGLNQRYQRGKSMGGKGGVGMGGMY